MILEEAKSLLVEHGIPFELAEYKNEKEYWHHTMLFPYTDNAKCCKVIAVVIRSNNGSKDIELQFNETDGGFVFEELRFGDFCCEYFDVSEDALAEQLISSITEIQQGDLTVIAANDLKKKRWVGDSMFASKGSDGTMGYEEAMQKIHRPPGFLRKLLKSKTQYEIYDWNSYQCIVK